MQPKIKPLVFALITFLPTLVGAWQVESVFGVTIASTNGPILSSYIGIMLGFIYSISGVLIILRLVSAGYLYIQSQGNPKQIEVAKRMIKRGLEGLAMIFLAFIFAGFFSNDLLLNFIY